MKNYSRQQSHAMKGSKESFSYLKKKEKNYIYLHSMVIILKNNIPSAFKWVCLYKKLMCINHTSFPANGRIM